MKTKPQARALAAAMITLASLAGGANAAVVYFDINQSFSQGTGMPDIPTTNVPIGGAGFFEMDPGPSGNYMDFDMIGAFAADGYSPGGYPWMKSFAVGNTITLSDNFDTSNWTTILDGGVTTGAWDSSHSGFVAFKADNGELGYISYDYTRDAGVSTITFNSGAYESDAGQSITIIPEPSTLLVSSLACIGLLGRRRRNG